MDAQHRPLYTARHRRVAPQIRVAGVAGDVSEPPVGAFCGGGPRPPSTTAPTAMGVSRDPDLRYGVRTTNDLGVDACLRPDLHIPRADAFLAARQPPQRRKDAPLGRSRALSSSWMAPVGGFGIRTTKDGSTADALNGSRDVDVRHPPGVMLNRGYDWEAAGIDASAHRFGKPTSHNTPTNDQTMERMDSAAGGMRRLAGAPRYHGALAMVPKIVRDHARATAFPLGKSRPYGFAACENDHTHHHNTNNNNKKNDNTNQDDDIQTTSRKMVVAAPARGCTSNGFQVEQPTVKELLSTWAVHAPKDASVKSPKKPPCSAAITAPPTPIAAAAAAEKPPRKLGDEATAAQLLYPCHYVALGVDSKSFAGGRDLDDIRELSLKCRFGLTEAQIQHVFAAIAVEGKCGIEQFKNAARAMKLM